MALPSRKCGSAGESQGHIGGVVAVLTALGPLHPHLGHRHGRQEQAKLTKQPDQICADLPAAVRAPEPPPPEIVTVGAET